MFPLSVKILLWLVCQSKTEKVIRNYHNCYNWHKILRYQFQLLFVLLLYVALVLAVNFGMNNKLWNCLFFDIFIMKSAYLYFALIVSLLCSSILHIRNLFSSLHAMKNNFQTDFSYFLNPCSFLYGSPFITFRQSRNLCRQDGNIKDKTCNNCRLFLFKWY